MPDTRVVTWNSTGENAAKALELAAIPVAIAALHVGHPTVDVYLIQEAQNAAGGNISNWLTGLPGFTVHHLAENPAGGGGGYICATRNANAAVVAPLALYNHAADPNWGNGWTGHANFNQVAVLARPPAYTVLTIGGVTVLLITWHAPLGVSALPIIVGAMPGGALLDGYLALEQSQLIQNPAAVAGVAVDNVIVAGDLNATAAGLAGPYPPAGAGGPYFRPLAQFAGNGNHLDHILAHRPLGAVQVVEGHSTASTSVHDILSSRVTW